MCTSKKVLFKFCTRDLLIKLFEKNPKKRLGANGAIEVK